MSNKVTERRGEFRDNLRIRRKKKGREWLYDTGRNGKTTCLGWWNDKSKEAKRHEECLKAVVRCNVESHACGLTWMVDGQLAQRGVRCPEEESGRGSVQGEETRLKPKSQSKLIFFGSLYTILDRFFFSWYSSAACHAPPANVPAMPIELAGAMARWNKFANRIVRTCLTLGYRVKYVGLSSLMQE